MIQVLKGLANAIALAVALLPASTAWLEARLSSREQIFLFWGQLFSLLPGLPGDYLRRGYYRWTLRACSKSSTVGFLSQICHRDSELGQGVLIGSMAHIGMASIGDGSLIGARVSIPSGTRQHRFGVNGRLEEGSFERVSIGADSWVGEAAIVMADVGSRCVVAAGTVVSSSVPDGCIVGGNPCRLVGRSSDSQISKPEPAKALSR